MRLTSFNPIVNKYDMIYNNNNNNSSIYFSGALKWPDGLLLGTPTPANVIFRTILLLILKINMQIYIDPYIPTRIEVTKS